MEKEVINLYVNQNKSVSEISKKLKMSMEDVYKHLHNNYYFATRGRKKDCVLKLKPAIEYYIANKISVTKTARMFNIAEETLSSALKHIGINPLDRNTNATEFNKHIFDVIDSEEKAYWLGFIFADGYISSSPLKDENPKWTFEFCLALIDTGHLFKFDKFVEVEKSKVKVYNYTDYKGEIKQHSKWLITNEHFWKTLNDLGCTPNKSLTLAYPKIPQHLMRHFARGYFDGDGSFGIYHSQKSVNDELNLSCVGTDNILQNLFKELNIDVNIYHHPSHSEETLTLNVSQYKAKKLLDYMYNDATIYLDRKYNEYLKVCRVFKKLNTELQGNIGEGCDANTEITEETKEFSAS